jgi:hypothetical protein
MKPSELGFGARESVVQSGKELLGVMKALGIKLKPRAA